uniref:NADH-ubiquinone oxidoreductase chain 4 n=1 Tax=Trebouxia lynnae TaxID=1825957 RepID=A0A5J6DTJ8_9CHLO|nr:NADH dehydrogenase subunit 4 [Trebouxia lynnae]
MTLLLFCLLFPLFGALILLFVPSWNYKLIRSVALYISLGTFLLSLLLWIQFDNSTGKFQFMQSFALVEHAAKQPEYSSLTFIIGIDGISLFFIILTTFLIPVCILVGWKSIIVYVKEYCIAFLVLESLMICFFSVLDLLLFYVFFESVLIPMFIIIGIWGSRERKIRAAYQFFLYTLFGSVLMLLAILLIYFQSGTTDLQILYTTLFSETREILLWLFFFASFAVKVPMVPVHIWLPEAHVEAPTAGSVILAGIMLKLGTYGFLRLSLPFFPYACIYFTPLIYTMSVIAIIYTSLTTLRQVDLKKIIAYSSVAHMNFITIGLFTLNTQGVEGSVMLMLSHGIVSPALFLLVGVLYDRHKTRLLRYYAGCGRTMPLFAIMFLFFTMANLSLPGTSSFIGEFLVLTGLFQTNTFVAVLATTGTILGAAYALWLCNRVIYGIGKVYYINCFSDLTRREFFMFLPFVILVLWMGLQPEPFLNSLHSSIGNVVNHPFWK